MKNSMTRVTMVCVCLALPLMGSSRDARAQGGAVMTYPRSGQSQDQHDRDRMECSQSAIDRTLEPKAADGYGGSYSYEFRITTP